MADILSVSQGILNNLSSTVPQLGKDIGTLGKMALPPEMASKLGKSSIDQMAEHVLTRTWDMSFRAVAAVALVTAGWLFSSWVATRTQNLLIRLRVEETLAAFLGSMLRFIIFFSTFVGGMVVIGVNTTSLAAVLGATALAVGLALKGTLGHVASGVMLMVHRPFKVGDWVETTDKIQGAVKRIGLFSTEINSIDNKRIFVPNTVFWENVITNHTYQRIRMQEFRLLLSYMDDTGKTLDIIRQTVLENPYVLTMPEPLVGMTGFALLGAECTIRVWHRKEDYTAVQFGLMEQVKAALDKAGMDIPTQPQIWKTDVERQRRDADEKKAAEAATKTKPTPRKPKSRKKK